MKLIHRQFDSIEHEKRFRKLMLSKGYTKEKIDEVIKLIKQKRFFDRPRDEL